MATKLKKIPTAPKLPKKPKASASLTAKENWVKRVAEQKKIYAAKVANVKKVNAQIMKDKSASEKLSKVISGTQRATAGK